MITSFGIESLNMIPIDAAIFAFALDKTNSWVESVIAEFSVTRHVEEHI